MALELPRPCRSPQSSSLCPREWGLKPFHPHPSWHLVNTSLYLPPSHLPHWEHCEAASKPALFTCLAQSLRDTSLNDRL